MIEHIYIYYSYQNLIHIYLIIHYEFKVIYQLPLIKIIVMFIIMKLIHFLFNVIILIFYDISYFLKLH